MIGIRQMALMAQAAPAAPGQGGPPPWTQLVFFGLIFIVFYFVLIRPQQKKAKDHELLVKSLKSGDKVLTSGGIVGVVITVKERTISMRSADTKLEILKSAVAEITERGSEGSPS